VAFFAGLQAPTTSAKLLSGVAGHWPAGHSRAPLLPYSPSLI